MSLTMISLEIRKTTFIELDVLVVLELKVPHIPISLRIMLSKLVNLFPFSLKPSRTLILSLRKWPAIQAVVVVVTTAVAAMVVVVSVVEEVMETVIGVLPEVILPPLRVHVGDQQSAYFEI